MNQHCGKHDKIYTEDIPCPGCVTETLSEVKGPDDLLADLRGVNEQKKKTKKSSAED